MSISAENAFLSHFLNLGVGWMDAQFSKGGWHAYGVAPGFPGGDCCEGSGIRGCKFWIRMIGEGLIGCSGASEFGVIFVELNINSENFFTKLCKPSRICLIHISRPASPDSCKSGTVSHIKHTAQLMLDLVCSEIRNTSVHQSDHYGKGFQPT